LTGCASFPKTPETSSDFSNRVQVSDSKFDSHIKFSGHTMSSDFLNGSILCPYDWERYFLRGWKNKKNGNKRGNHMITRSYSIIYAMTTSIFVSLPCD
jgi:hypothetical protein